MANIKSIGGNPIVPASVEDGSITKAKLATDLARDRERLLYRLANMLTAQLPEGDAATATDAAQTPLAGLSLYGLSTQDGTPTPSTPVSIESVAPDSQGNISLWARGRNLMPPTVYNLALIAANPPYIYGGSDYRGVWCACEPNTTYTFTRDTVSGNRLGIATTTEAPAQSGVCTIVVSAETTPSRSKTFTTPADAKFIFVYLANDGSTITQDFALYRGSTAHAYEPYTATVTPIPLDGHELRSLPDGTRDEVTVDADGHAVLVQRVQLTTQAVTDGVTGTVGVDVMSSTGAIANGATVLYKLATPVTHDLGYVAAVPLVGPDLTAQAVPTAPFALTYERDLNITLARLESAIANLV